MKRWKSAAAAAFVEFASQDRVEEGFASFFAQVEHILEASVSSVIRVRDVLDTSSEGGQEQLHLGVLTRIFHPADELEVALVHAKDPVVALQVGASELAGLVSGQVVTTALGVFRGALVGPFAYMERLGAAGVDGEAMLQIALAHNCLEHDLGSGGTADVAGTNEQNVNFLFHSMVNKG